MSSEARDWVWEHSSSRGTARLVLLSIADRVADEQCVSWASLSSLAKRTRASLSTVREAIDRLVEAGELEQLDDLTGPQRSTVYRLPLAAEAVAATAENDEDGDPASQEAPESAPTLRISALRPYGIRPREVPISPAGVRKPAVAETGRSRRKPVPRRTGNRHSDVPETGTQSRSEPDGNRRYSSSAGAAVLSAAEWQLDPATHTWAHQQGHLDRLGEQGLRAADAKWRAHRAGHAPRPAGAWAADWRSWVAREHAPTRPNLYAVPGKNTAAPGGMTRTEAHTAALLAALDEPTGTEG